MWPTVAAVGFVVLTGLVVVLGASSTASYEFQLNRVPDRARAAARGSTTHPAGRRPAPREAEAQSGPRAEGIGVAVHPPETVTAVGGPSRKGWWLVEPAWDGPGAQVVAGPFPDRIDADWAALSGGLSATAAYGVCSADGRLAPRPSPEERAWLAELGDQLDGLHDDWDALLTDSDPLTSLVVEVAAALVEAGLPLHDCALRTPSLGGSAGGVCLTPDPALRGVHVGWRAHDRMSLQHVRGVAADAAVNEAMNGAVADVLARLGFAVEPAGGGCLVTTLDR